MGFYSDRVWGSYGSYYSIQISLSITDFLAYFPAVTIKNIDPRLHDLLRQQKDWTIVTEQSSPGAE